MSLALGNHGPQSKTIGEGTRYEPLFLRSLRFRSDAGQGAMNSIPRMSIVNTMLGVVGVALAVVGLSAAAPGPAAKPSIDPASHWAFQPVCNPAPPSVADVAWCRSPLDRFILAGLERQGRKPALEADRRT